MSKRDRNFQNEDGIILETIVEKILEVTNLHSPKTTIVHFHDIFGIWQIFSEETYESLGLKTIGDVADNEEKFFWKKVPVPLALRYELSVKRKFFEKLNPYKLRKHPVLSLTQKQRNQKLVDLRKALKKTKSVINDLEKSSLENPVADPFYAWVFIQEGEGEEFSKEFLAINTFYKRVDYLLADLPPPTTPNKPRGFQGDSATRTVIKNLLHTYETVFGKKPYIGDEPTGPAFRFVRECLERIYPEIEKMEDVKIQNFIKTILKARKRAQGKGE